MAKGGKGRKGGGGGAGPKQRKYERDNNGRFASTGSGGATARGGRLLTAKGNKRTARALAGKTKTIEATGQKGVLAKPKGLKPGSIKPKAAAAAKPVAKKSRFTPSESAERKQRAVELKAIPKATRRAERIGRVAGRQRVSKGNVGVGIIGKNKPTNDQLIGSLREGAIRLKADKTGTVGKSMQNTANKLRGRMATTGASPRTGAQGGAKVKRITAAKPKSVINKAKPNAVAAKPATRKEQLAAGAKKRTAQADRIDAKIKKLESEYRGKDAAFYTQGAKPAGRDRMIAKSQKAAQLREESASLRTKAANAERMSSKIKDKPIKSSGGNKRLDRAIKNEAAGSTSYKRNPKGYQKRITALTAQKVYQTGDATTGLSVAQYAGKGFRLPRNQRAASAKPAAPKALTPAERIKIKTPIIRAKRANRASVVTPGQRSRLETGKGAKIKGARLNSSVAKPRTAGNTKPQVASRVKRKLAAENAKMNKIVGAERVGARQGKQYERSLKRQTTLERAKTFLESGKLPGKDNSIAAQRNTKQARQRLAAKNAERRNASAKPAAAAKPAAKVDTSMKGITVRRARALAPRTSTYLSQKLNIQSDITKSAANAIYNRQRTIGKALGLDEAVVRNPIGIMPKISGSIRSRAAQLREAARKRVVGGRRR